MNPNKSSAVFSANLIKEMESVAVYKSFKAEEIIIPVGTYMRSIPIVESGAIRVSRVDDEGHELLLYFLEAGDTCAATMTCCMNRQKSSIKAVAELDTKVALLPIERMDEWVAKYPSWRSFVFGSYQQRFDELLGAIDSVAFHNLEDRLLKMLKEKSILRDSKMIEGTHQQLAMELNTARVVVSRVLKSLENREVLKLHRNRIELLS